MVGIVEIGVPILLRAVGSQPASRECICIKEQVRIAAALLKAPKKSGGGKVGKPR